VNLYARTIAYAEEFITKRVESAGRPVAISELFLLMKRI